MRVHLLSWISDLLPVCRGATSADGFMSQSGHKPNKNELFIQIGMAVVCHQIHNFITFI